MALDVDDSYEGEFGGGAEAVNDEIRWSCYGWRLRMAASEGRGFIDLEVHFREQPLASLAMDTTCVTVQMWTRSVGKSFIERFRLGIKFFIVCCII